MVRWRADGFGGRRAAAVMPMRSAGQALVIEVKPLAGFQSRGIHLITRTPNGLEMYMLFGGQMNHESIEHNL